MMVQRKEEKSDSFLFPTVFKKASIQTDIQHTAFPDNSRITIYTLVRLLHWLRESQKCLLLEL